MGWTPHVLSVVACTSTQPYAERRLPPGLRAATFEGEAVSTRQHALQRGPTRRAVRAQAEAALGAVRGLLPLRYDIGAAVLYFKLARGPSRGAGGGEGGGARGGGSRLGLGAPELLLLWCGGLRLRARGADGPQAVPRALPTALVPVRPSFSRMSEALPPSAFRCPVCAAIVDSRAQ